MRRVRMLVATAAALCALAIVPVASAGWEGQIDFIGEDNGGTQIDVGPKGPSPGDMMTFNQTIEVVGLTRSQASLRIGAAGTLSGTFTYLTPNLISAAITVKLKAGLIHVTGWLAGPLTGPPTDATFLAKGNGGLFTGSRGTVVVYDNGNGNSREQTGLDQQPDFSIILH